MKEYIIIAAIALVFIVIIYRRRNIFGGGGNFDYSKVGDLNAQVSYEKAKSADIPRLTAKEFLELSWKFLYDVTEKVLYKFSARSREAVHVCGESLLKYGARYTHIIDYTPLRNVNRAKAIDDGPNDPTSIQR